jgi:hypothetical protein
VIYGSATGLSQSRGNIWTQNSAGVEDQVNARDQFGRGLASGDLDGDGRADLVVGVPGESLGTAICNGRWQPTAPPLTRSRRRRGAWARPTSSTGANRA